MANRSSTERKGKAVLEPHHVAAQFPTSSRNGTSLQPLEVKYPNQISLNKAPQNPNANAMNFPSSVLLKNALSSLTETPNSKSPGSSSTAHHANPTTSTNYGNKIHTSSLSTIPTQANNIHLGSVPYPLAQANDGQGGNRSLPRNQRLPGVGTSGRAASELPYSRTGILGTSPEVARGPLDQ